MREKWLSSEILTKQEQICYAKTQTFWGKGRYGFCDFALDGIDLLIQGIAYLRDKEGELDKKIRLAKALLGLPVRETKK